RIYVSSLANFDTTTRTDFLRGNLDQLHGMLNIRAGDGRDLLMISDESQTRDKTVLVTDQTSRALALDPSVPGSASEISSHPNVPQGTTHLIDTDTEIYVVGLAEGAITYSTSLGAKGNFADGITIWGGYGNDTWDIDGTHRRANVREITTIDTGLGDDNVTVDLTAGEDGFFVLNTQGPDNTLPLTRDNDTVHAETSTLPLVIFGGQGDDRIHGGTGGDTTVGGNDTITTGTSAATDIVFGGVDTDTITTDRGGAAGDGSAIVVGDNGFVDWQLLDGNPSDIDRIWSIDPNTGGSDTITTGDGGDVIIGGEDGELVTETSNSGAHTVSAYGPAGDTIDAGNGDNVVFG